MRGLATFGDGGDEVGRQEGEAQVWRAIFGCRPISAARSSIETRRPLSSARSQRRTMA
jgi:hypothetical protein